MISRSQSFGAACIKSMAAVATSLVPLLFFARVSGLAVALLVIFWALSFKSSFLPHSPPQEHQGLIYSALHPLFMVIAFILISGEAIRWLPGSRSVKKSVCILLFGAQISDLEWLMGFLSFWHRGEVRAVRLRVLPWRVFIGLYTYGLAMATAETGLLEKLTFLQTKRNVSKHCAVQSRCL